MYLRVYEKHTNKHTSFNKLNVSLRYMCMISIQLSIILKIE